jgi:hypothetical protein
MRAPMFTNNHKKTTNVSAGKSITTIIIVAFLKW